MVHLLRRTVAEVRRDLPFTVKAGVILPDHLHTIWTLPEEDAGCPERWRLIKARFSRRCGLEPAEATAQTARGGRGIWQNRYWEHRIRDDEDMARHLDYIHWNPVRHGLVRRPGDWPWSSYGRFVEAGYYAGDWEPAEEFSGIIE